MEQQQGKPQAQGREGTTLFYCQSEKDAGSRCLTVCDYCNKLGTSLPPSPSIEAIKYDYWKILHCWKWELDELLGPMWYQETLSGESEMITTEQLYDRYKQTTPTSPLPASTSVKVEELEFFLYDISGGYDCDSDAHKYGTRCRACEAKKLLQSNFPNSKYLK